MVWVGRGWPARPAARCLRASAGSSAAQPAAPHSPTRVSQPLSTCPPTYLPLSTHPPARCAAALKPHCDLLLCETLATVTEGVAAASAAAASGLPWWISWTLEDSERVLLRSGEPLQVRVAPP